MYLGGSPSLLMTKFYHNLSMQALSKSDDSVRKEFIAINDRIEATIISTKEWDTFCILFG